MVSNIRDLFSHLSPSNGILVMKSAFEPYRDLKDNLHKDLAAKLLATDTVIKQTITQIFRSKVGQHRFFTNMTFFSSF